MAENLIEVLQHTRLHICLEAADEIKRLYKERRGWQETVADLATETSVLEERLHALLIAGDALATAYRKLGGLDVAHDNALAAWEAVRA